MKKKIFVVDDDQGIVDALTLLLETEGYEVYSFDSGEFVAKLSTLMPHLILLDVLLSGEDGRDIAKYLKSQPLSHKIPIIMLSAHPNALDIAQNAGADDFLAKPFEIETLLSRISAFLG